MNQFITNIVTSAVSLLVKALSFIPGITQADFDLACDLATTQIATAKTTFNTASTETEAAKVESMIGDGLEVAKNACDAAGDTKFDTYFTIAEQVDAELEAGTFNFISAIKAWVQAKKASKA